MSQSDNKRVAKGHLPRQFTSFVGRKRELAEIEQRLADPSCRMLTLVGPGGIGKTRLALAALSACAGHFPDGIYFVNLQPVDETTVFIATLADSLGISLSGQAEPLPQLCRHLAKRQLLLVLDNFEQLTSSSDVLLSLLQETAVSLLITSREPLNLQEEWRFPVYGLPLTGEDSEAVQLFADRAQRVQPRFALETELPHVAQICQIVAGMPLAIELAAAWTRSLPCAEIVAAIHRNLDFLGTRLRNVPERHRSIRVIFEQTWQRLSDEEQRVFCYLSLFRGGFRLQAARAVAGASLTILSALMDKSLLRWEAESEHETIYGRYQVHELLRQYAQEILGASEGGLQAGRALHSQYYADFVAGRLNGLLGKQQKQALAEIEAELDNIRAAWQWSVRHQDLNKLRQLASPLHAFFWHQSRSLEPITRYEQAIDALRQSPPSRQRDIVLAVLLNNLGWFLTGLGQFERSNRLALESWQLYQTHDQLPEPGYETDPRLLLGDNLRYAERFEEAADYLVAARSDNRRTQHFSNLHLAIRLLAEIRLAQGRFNEAEQNALEAFTIAQQQEDLSGLSYTHDTLGDIALAQQAYGLAQHHYEMGCAIRRELGFRLGLAIGLRRLGELALQRREYAAADAYLRESLPLYQAHFSKGGELITLVDLGQTAVANQDQVKAKAYFLQAMPLIREIGSQYADIMRSFLLSGAEWLLADQKTADAAALLGNVQADYQLGEQEVQKTADLLGTCRATLGKEETDAALVKGRAKPLAAHLAVLQHHFTHARPETSSPAEQPLVEPLTKRELDVLRLIADGYTNQQIADELILSLGTVKYYSSHIYGKLGVSHRTQAVAKARELGIVA